MADGSDSGNESDGTAPRDALAAAFDTTTDPLAAHAATFEALDVDPFELFLTEVLAPRNPAPSTRRTYERLFGRWREHMARQDRHPACPNETHVRAFVEHCVTARGNQPDTVRTKLRRLTGTFEYWQADPVFPHPDDYNPFTLVLSKLDLERPPGKEPPRIAIETLADQLAPVTDIRELVIIATQLKLGLRASELANIQLADLQLADADLQAAYPALGTHDRLDGRANAVYIPSRHERARNKSWRPRVLPLDDELQALFAQYLRIRPDTGADWALLTRLTHNQLNVDCINRVWHAWFHPEYAETDTHRGVTSHYGRHRFTTYWQVDQPIARELVKYLRGDRVEGVDPTREGIDHYIHTYYEDVAPTYRTEIFTLGIDPECTLDSSLDRDR